MAIGGSVESVTLAGRSFAVAADAETQRKLGGFDNAVEANGDGTARLIKTRTPWQVDGITLECDDGRGDHEFIQDLADRPDYFPIAVTYASAETYQGVGQITGDLQTSSQKATTTVNLMGPGKLTRQ